MPRPQLAARYDLAFVQSALLPPSAWRRYPAASEREAWEKIPAAVRQDLIARGETRAAEEWEHLTATLILNYVRHGGRDAYQEPYYRRRTRLHDLVLAECAEGRGRFLDAIADNLWLTCEETYWGIAAHLYLQAAGPGLPDATEPTVDLFAGETAALLAWTMHLLGESLDGVSPLLRPRLRHEIERRVLTPCRERDDFWWMGWHRGRHPINNWNPWVNSNWLAAVLVCETDPERRARAVHKIMRSLDVFIHHQPDDGGCEEGPVYWSRAAGSLYDCLDLLHQATAGKINLFDEPLIANLGRFIMHGHLHGDWYVNFADASAQPVIDAALVQRYGRAVGDRDLVAFGQWAEHRQAGRSLGRILSINRTLAALHEPVPSSGPLPARPADVWLPDLQFAIARGRRFTLAAKGGHNEESHNHNDVGSFILCLDGSPLLIDIGVEVYTAKTFSPRRYEIWAMQSQWHNLPTINGAMQHKDRDYAARDVRFAGDDRAATFSLDLAGAYDAEAAVRRWTRTFRLERNGPLVLTDDFELREARAPAVWNFICHREPVPTADGAVRLTSTDGAAAILSHAADAYAVEIDAVTITDPNLHAVWGDHLYRLRLTARENPTAARHAFTVSAL